MKYKDEKKNKRFKKHSLISGISYVFRGCSTKIMWVMCDLLYYEWNFNIWKQLCEKLLIACV